VASTDAAAHEPARSLPLPRWARVGEKRRAHIVRVTALLQAWAAELALPVAEADAWRDAGLLHDALRDAPDDELRALVRSGDGAAAGAADEVPAEMLHGPAAAVMLARQGERRTELLDAVRWHTVGSVSWGRLGRALFMADYLEPGRKFSQADRAFLAGHVTTDFDGVFRQVVRQRLEWSLREGKRLFPETVALWNSLR
jgi:2-amino-4-hydroxy-6-hydroxymethyldihydropteridine diphosphokinase